MALFVAPRYVAEINADVSALTGMVVTVNVADDCPAATVTLGGTAACAGRELLSETTMPPAGAGPVSVTVAVTLPPPVTLDALSARAAVLGSVTVSVAVFGAAPVDVADSVVVVPLVTGVVETPNVAVDAPAGTVTVAGADATPGFELAIVTGVPPAGAARASVTVAMDVAPPTTRTGHLCCEPAHRRRRNPPSPSPPFEATSIPTR